MRTATVLIKEIIAKFFNDVRMSHLATKYNMAKSTNLFLHFTLAYALYINFFHNYTSFSYHIQLY